ncbi:hypothetical protein [Brevibacillus choshinensis]|uniref:Uncharacterized protein n=1 Tax=Brevibacillus choshinensis TaxID=54911 RepID=A0ABX7FUW5_BRECH|nr:hypothetical protein [Brevibacillus choshinensis]QRG69896.1 hypothetical protein JNE38_12680 [Brevibacillus choshinensis]
MSNKVSNNRKWRNPYALIPSKKLSEQVTDASLAVTPKKVVPAVDLRTSVSKMRNNIKGISSTIRQVEETMDTLYGAMEIFENFGKRSEEKAEPVAATEKPARRRKGASEASRMVEESPEPESAPTTNSNPLGNIDLGQLLGLLQSPLVQNLLSQTVGGNNSKQRKKEG